MVPSSALFHPNPGASGYRVGMLSAADLDRVAFTQVRWRGGYDIDEVDSFLQRVRLVIAAGPSAAPTLRAVDVVNQRFQPTKFRPGYSQDEVDRLLDRVAHTLVAYGA